MAILSGGLTSIVSSSYIYKMYYFMISLYKLKIYDSLETAKSVTIDAEKHNLQSNH